MYQKFKYQKLQSSNKRSVIEVFSYPKLFKYKVCYSEVQLSKVQIYEKSVVQKIRHLKSSCQKFSCPLLNPTFQFYSRVDHRVYGSFLRGQAGLPQPRRTPHWWHAIVRPGILPAKYKFKNIIKTKPIKAITLCKTTGTMARLKKNSLSMKLSFYEMHFMS